MRVKSPDRLARSTTDLLSLVEQLRAKGVAVEFVDNPALNTDTPQGEFMLTILAAVAQLERATIRERQAEGIAIAKRNGVYDRGPKLTPEQVSEARQRADSGVPKVQRWPELWPRDVERSTRTSAPRGDTSSVHRRRSSEKRSRNVVGSLHEGVTKAPPPQCFLGESGPSIWR